MLFSVKRLSVLFLFIVFVGCKTTNSDRFYKIRIEEGDTLSKIAEKYGTSPEAIIELNRLGNGEDIVPGQVLYLKPNLDFSNRAIADREDEKSRGNDSGLLFGNSKSVIWPVNGDVSSEFGRRNGRPHEGIDIRAKYGTSIKAVANGKVKSAGWVSGYGRMVVVSHDGYETLYAHCSKIHVKAGQIIRQGQVLGLVGTSGRSTGPHLHFEYRSASGRPMNPRLILKNSLLSSN